MDDFPSEVTFIWNLFCSIFPLITSLLWEFPWISAHIKADQDEYIYITWFPSFSVQWLANTKCHFCSTQWISDTSLDTKIHVELSENRRSQERVIMKARARETRKKRHISVRRKRTCNSFAVIRLILGQVVCSIISRGLITLKSHF